MTLPLIGEPRDRVDGDVKVTGGARFATETNIAGIVHAVVVPATIPSGRIKSIDDTAAKKSAGVLAVITYLNAPKLNPPPAQNSGQRQSGGGQSGGGQSGGGAKPASAPPPNSGNYAEPHLLPFSGPEIHYLGQQIAIVVAETLEQATHAANLVRITYEETPAKVDLHDHRSEGTDKGSEQAPPVHVGDADTAFAAAAVKIDQIYRTPYEHHNPMEAHSLVADWVGNRLEVRDSSQNIFGVKTTLAQAFGIPRENVHVISPFVGGAFGSKGSTWPHVFAATIASYQLRKPVKLWLSRKQLFFTNGHRPATEQRVALGAGADGKLVAMIHEGVSQGNSVSDYNERFTRPTRTIYACPNIRASNKVVDLNISSPTYMRAPGECVGMYAIESAMDELAIALKMDPIALRLANYAEDDPVEHKPWSSKSLRQCYQQAAERFGWSRRNPEPRSMRDGRLLIGMGMASATYPSHRAPASAIARIDDKGNVSISCGTHEMGMGTATVMQQLAAGTLGVPFDRVHFSYGDTILPQAPISAGSMTAATVGSTVYQVVNELKRKLVELNGGHELAAGDSYAALLKRNNVASLDAQADSKPDPEESKYEAHAFGAQFAEVSVDPDLGIVRVRRIVSAFGGGRILNAKTARSQYYGGIIQGIGCALLEQTRMDDRIGSFTNVNLGEYLLPVNADVPPIEVIMVEEEDPHVNPIGAKGIGEIGIIGVAPAIANAVYHATGKRVRDLPITIEKVL
jgi:xanthine dehydrogenase YagR molybdenum-binding subunit